MESVNGLTGLDRTEYVMFMAREALGQDFLRGFTLALVRQKVDPDEIEVEVCRMMVLDGYPSPIPGVRVLYDAKVG